jgi:hypothetical protein
VVEPEPGGLAVDVSDGDASVDERGRCRRLSVLDTADRRAVEQHPDPDTSVDGRPQRGDDPSGAERVPRQQNTILGGS